VTNDLAVGMDSKSETGGLGRPKQKSSYQALSKIGRVFAKVNKSLAAWRGLCPGK